MATVAELMGRTCCGSSTNATTSGAAKAIEATYAADVMFADPEGVVTGRDATEREGEGLAGAVAGVRVRGGGPGARSTTTWGTWPGLSARKAAPPVARGIDVALVEDGRIKKLYTMLLPD